MPLQGSSLPIKIHDGVQEVVGSLQLVPEEEVGLAEFELLELFKGRKGRAMTLVSV